MLSNIVVLLDSSGSMARLRQETITGFNKFIEEQKLEDGEAIATLVTFDSNVKTVFKNKDLKEFKKISDKDYSTGGYTALYKAVGQTIDETGEYLNSLSDDQKPQNTIFAIFTDGFDNVSDEKYNQQIVKDMVVHQQEKYGWQFVFFGAGLDAVQQGGNIGIRAAASVSYAADATATMDSYMTLSSFTKSVRKGGSI